MPSVTSRLAAGLSAVTGGMIVLAARFVTALQAIWQGVDPGDGRQRVYFANHSSHGDFILIWSALPPAQRRRTRPVAGADYWRAGLRGVLARQVFDALLIDRDHVGRANNPIGAMAAALDAGSTLIVFPEGTRNQGEAPLLPFRAGLWHLARARPGIDLVPVWIENLNRVLPKGSIVPVPLMCRITFGAPLHLAAAEPKAAFLARAQAALLALRPGGAQGVPIAAVAR